MNVKSLSNTSLSVVESSQGAKETPKAVKSEGSSKDRDADGRRQQENKEQRRPMTEEQFREAFEKLKAKEIFKESGLTFETGVSGEIKVVIIKDHLGKVVRRVPEYELWSAIEAPDQTTGHLLNKAM